MGVYGANGVGHFVYTYSCDHFLDWNLVTAGVYGEKGADHGVDTYPCNHLLPGYGVSAGSPFGCSGALASRAVCPTSAPTLLWTQRGCGYGDCCGEL